MGDGLDLVSPQGLSFEYFVSPDEHFPLPHDDLSHLDLFLRVQTSLGLVEQSREHLAVSDGVLKGLFADEHVFSVVLANEDVVLGVDAVNVGEFVGFVGVVGDIALDGDFLGHLGETDVHRPGGVRDTSGRLRHQINCSLNGLAH